MSDLRGKYKVKTKPLPLSSGGSGGVVKLVLNLEQDESDLDFRL